MAAKPKAIMAWSSGKDSALALHETLRRREVEVVALLTTVTRKYDRISMHGVRQELLEKQAESLRLPLEIMLISPRSSNREYEARMRRTLLKYKKQGVSHVIFGDIFLEDLRKYREARLAKLGLAGMFPLWKKDTAKLARAFIKLGFQAVIACVDMNSLDRNFAGRNFDERFLRELPRTVDPCGENGEFHSFVCAGPVFHKPIRIQTGKTVIKRKRFCFCDLIPV